LFVNRRPVKNATILHAVAEGYGSFLAKGHYPLFVLFLDIDPARVDVNVHPAKREVRFSEQEAIHQLVRRAIRQALGRTGDVSESVPAPRDTESTGSGLVFPSTGGVPQFNPASRAGWFSRPDAGTPSPSRPDQLAFVSETAEPYTRVPTREIVPLGQLHHTFLVVQVGGALTIIDQHTAHERVLFERLYRDWVARGLRSQPLLIPESVELSAPHAALLQRHREELEQLGVELEPFGPTTVLVRSVPVGLGKVDAVGLVQDILDDLSSWGQASSVEERVRPVLASLACHSAVRAGRSMGLPEIRQLADDWLTEGKIQTCPHGRRTSFELTEGELEKIFGRVGW
jgi:DNA mismatch repair protein MutL